MGDTKNMPQSAVPNVFRDYVEKTATNLKLKAPATSHSLKITEQFFLTSRARRECENTEMLGNTC